MRNEYTLCVITWVDLGIYVTVNIDLAVQIDPINPIG